MKKVSNVKELGAILRQRRKEAGLTLKDAAGMAGVGIRFLSELERGKPTLQLGLQLKSCSCLDSNFMFARVGNLNERMSLRALSSGACWPARAKRCTHHEVCICRWMLRSAARFRSRSRYLWMDPSLIRKAITSSQICYPKVMYANRFVSR